MKRGVCVPPLLSIRLTALIGGYLVEVEGFPRGQYGEYIPAQGWGMCDKKVKRPESKARWGTVGFASSTPAHPASIVEEGNKPECVE